MVSLHFISIITNSFAKLTKSSSLLYFAISFLNVLTMIIVKIPAIQINIYIHSKTLYQTIFTRSLQDILIDMGSIFIKWVICPSAFTLSLHTVVCHCLNYGIISIFYNDIVGHLMTAFFWSFFAHYRLLFFFPSICYFNAHM